MDLKSLVVFFTTIYNTPLAKTLGETYGRVTTGPGPLVWTSSSTEETLHNIK